MENLSVYVENIKCGGCVTSITFELLKMKGVSSVNINIDEELIVVHGSDFSNEEIIFNGLPGEGQK